MFAEKAKSRAARGMLPNGYHCHKDLREAWSLVKLLLLKLCTLLIKQK
jgi:hypothetical protein